jgi:hypothetical protein
MFVEEAQGMPLESLEEMRMLSNLETTRDKLLQIVLFGQPELDEKLDRHEIRQLRERITHSFELAPLHRDQVRDYLNTRVRASGYRGEALFSSAAVTELERYSRGLLRRINVLADKALLAAFAANASTVRPAHVRLAVRDSEFKHDAAPRRRRWLAAAAAGVIVALGLAWALIREREIVPPPAPASSAPAPAAAAPAMLDQVVSAAPPAGGNSPAAPLPVPTLDAASGLVTDEHLAPRPLELPDAVAAGSGGAPGASGNPAK